MTQPFAYKRGPYPQRRRAKPNASPEADFQKALVVYLMYSLPPEYRFRAGLEGVKLSIAQAVQAKALGMRPDWLDIEIMNRRTGAVRWMEAKSATGRLTAGQAAFIAERPQDRVVVRTLEDAEAALVTWGIKPRCSIENANRYSTDRREGNDVR